MTSSNDADKLDDGLRDMNLDSTDDTLMQITGLQSSKSKPKPKPVADSWEDEATIDASDEDESKHISSAASTSDSERSTHAHDQRQPQSVRTGKSRVLEIPPQPGATAPPSTLQTSRPITSTNTPSRPSSARQQQDAATRPEKTTAPAARMIAAGLGLKTKRTEEERKFDRAQSEGLMRKREEGRRRQEEAERMRASMWDG